MPVTKTLIGWARDYRVEERKAADADPDLNLFTRYPAFLALMKQLLGNDENEPGEGLFQPEALSHLVEATQQALHSVWLSPAARRAVEDIYADCWNLLDDTERQSLSHVSCRDVGELALKDAMLCGITFWLHDIARSRKLQAPRTRPAKQSAGKRKGVSKTAKGRLRRQARPR